MFSIFAPIYWVSCYAIGLMVVGLNVGLLLKLEVSQLSLPVWIGAIVGGLIGWSTLYVRSAAQKPSPYLAKLMVSAGLVGSAFTGVLAIALGVMVYLLIGPGLSPDVAPSVMATVAPWLLATCIFAVPYGYYYQLYARTS